MTATTTEGQQLAATLHRIKHIGPRTRQHRGHLNMRDDIIESIRLAATMPGYYSPHTQEALSIGFVAVNAWTKHVEGYRLPGEQTAELMALSPWQFTALLGEMVDAGISNTGEAERWFRARRTARIAA